MEKNERYNYLKKMRAEIEIEMRELSRGTTLDFSKMKNVDTTIIGNYLRRIVLSIHFKDKHIVQHTGYTYMQTNRVMQAKIREMPIEQIEISNAMLSEIIDIYMKYYEDAPCNEVIDFIR